MEKDELKDFPHSDLLQQYVLQNEPSLSASERKKMWENIEKRTLLRTHRTASIWRWCAAASLLAFVVGCTILFLNTSHTDTYAHMAEMVDVDTLRHTSLFLGEQEVELNGQVEVRCMSETNQLEVKAANGVAFKMSIKKGETEQLQLAVPKGGKAEVILADKSRVTIREHSKFGFPLHFGKDNRTVYLEGEAYLKVTRNVNKQFVTKTPQMDVAVLGTEFLVSAYPNVAEQSVLLISGKVNVKPLQGSQQVLLPNQQYVLDTSTKRPKLNSNVDPALYLCWKENLLTIEDEPLNSVLKKLENIYNTDFNYDWNEMSEIHISGKLDVSVPLNELLDRLTKIAPIRIDATKKRITTYHNH